MSKLLKKKKEIQDIVDKLKNIHEVSIMYMRILFKHTKVFSVIIIYFKNINDLQEIMKTVKKMLIREIKI